jgi:hypothetical protein
VKENSSAFNFKLKLFFLDAKLEVRVTVTI